MRVLVIGGTGLTGPFVVRELHELGHEVVIVHRGQTEIALPDGVRHIHLTHERLRDYAEELRGIAPDVVLDMMPRNGEIARTTMDVFRDVARRVVAISSVDVSRVRCPLASGGRSTPAHAPDRGRRTARQPVSGRRRPGEHPGRGGGAGR